MGKIKVDDFIKAKGLLERQQRELYDVYQRELTYIGEALPGLYSFLTGEEDSTCAETRRLRGKRDKDWGGDKAWG